MLVKNVISELMKCNPKTPCYILAEGKQYHAFKIKEGSFTVNIMAPTHEEYMKYIYMKSFEDVPFPLPEKE